VCSRPGCLSLGSYGTKNDRGHVSPLHARHGLSAGHALLQRVLFILLVGIDLGPCELGLRGCLELSAVVVGNIVAPPPSTPSRRKGKVGGCGSLAC
jgi:hypothetical protein